MKRQKSWGAGITLTVCLVISCSHSVLSEQMPTETDANQRKLDQALVDRYYPQSVLDSYYDELRKNGEANKTAPFVVAGIDRTSRQEFLVAVYKSRSRDGVVRVLRRSGDAAVVVDEPPICMLDGTDPKVSLIDIDKSGNPAVLISTTVGKFHKQEQWLFRWDGSQLKPLHRANPHGGCIATDLQDATFIDLDGDGLLEIVNDSPGRDDDDSQTFDVYRFDGASYKLFNRLSYFSSFQEGRYHGRTDEFMVPQPGATYLMTIVNGNGKDLPPVTNARVSFNGELVAGPDKINAKMKPLSLRVTVTHKNSVNATMLNRGGGTLFIAIGTEKP